jgi:transcriptional regulator with XRE-family HTH domain
VSFASLQYVNTRKRRTSLLDKDLPIGNPLQMRKFDPSVWAAFLRWLDDEAERRGMPTREALATASGVASSTIARWATSESGPTLGVLTSVADALGLTMAEVGAAIDTARAGDPPPPVSRWPHLMSALLHAPDLADVGERDAVIEAVELVRRAWARS